jgi:hypothetical protein
MKITKDAYIQILSEQLGIVNSSNPELDLDVSLELCRSYSKMITDAFDKASRYVDNVNDMDVQFEIISRHLENLKKEMEISKKLISKKNK